MTEKQYPVFAPFEVIVHKNPNDCWLSFLGKVFDVTPIIKKHRDENVIKPLLAFAGKDVSHWFDKRTGEIQHYVHPVTGVEVPYCPHGRIPDVLYQVPTALWRPIEKVPWWKDDNYQVGILTKSVRPLKVINALIHKEITINVCCEDTFFRIAERYSVFCSEIEDYTWVHLDKKVDMNKTLEENGISDEREKMADLGIPKSFYIPSVFIYYNDNLKHYDDLDDEDVDDLDKICCTCYDHEVRKYNIF